MKPPQKAFWICGALLLCILIIGGLVITGKTPNYPELAASCDATLSKSPRNETVDTWLYSNNIPSKHLQAPLEDFFKEILIANGIAKSAADEAAACTFFEGLHLRGGILSTHVAYGYFLFSEDGTLIDYHLHDISYGM